MKTQKTIFNHERNTNEMPPCKRALMYAFVAVAFSNDAVTVST